MDKNSSSFKGRNVISDSLENNSAFEEDNCADSLASFTNLTRSDWYLDQREIQSKSFLIENRRVCGQGRQVRIRETILDVIQDIGNMILSWFPVLQILQTQISLLIY
jgi:hypothetical protein